jgi:uncharacterized phage protein gp47/JayE
MPWHTPTLREVRSLVRDHVRGTLPGADATIANSVLRVLSDVVGAVCHLTLQYIDWLARQLLPDTAETEWLDRHGDIWLTNADSTTGRKMATFASGTVLMTGTGGAVVPLATPLSSAVGAVGYETTAQVTLLAGAATSVPVRALDPGIAGNRAAGDTLALETAPTGVDSQAIVDEITGGVDDEADGDLRVRILERIQQPPMGGDATDYVAWAKAVPGVTRAWCFPQEMGLGTVTVRFMMDDLRADRDGFPLSEDVDNVTAYIDRRRPVTVKDFWALAPIRQPIDVDIANLVPDTAAVRADIEANLIAMLLQRASPGKTIFAAWKSYAVMDAPDVVSFDLVNNADDVMPSPGHLAVLGDIYYDGEVDTAGSSRQTLRG